MPSTACVPSLLVFQPCPRLARLVARLGALVLPFVASADPCELLPIALPDACLSPGASEVVVLKL